MSDGPALFVNRREGLVQLCFQVVVVGLVVKNVLYQKFQDVGVATQNTTVQGSVSRLQRKEKFY